MKKYFYSILVMALFAVGFTSSEDSEISNVPTNMEAVSAEQMILDLDKNAMSAQKKYADKWFEITGTLHSMGMDGDYITLGGKSMRLKDVRCELPKEKRNELTNKLINMETGDRISVKGKVTDVHEIFGYDVTIVDVYK